MRATSASKFTVAHTVYQSKSLSNWGHSGAIIENELPTCDHGKRSSDFAHCSLNDESMLMIYRQPGGEEEKTMIELIVWRYRNRWSKRNIKRVVMQDENREQKKYRWRAHWSSRVRRKHRHHVVWRLGAQIRKIDLWSNSLVTVWGHPFVVEYIVNDWGIRSRFMQERPLKCRISLIRLRLSS